MTNEANSADERLFGGMEPSALAALLRGGFATWIDTDAADAECTAAQAAVVVNAPIETTFATATDFGCFHQFVSLSKPSQIEHLGPNRQRVTFRQRIGLAFLSVGIDLTFEMRLEPPHRLICERYVDGAFSTALFAMDLVALDEESTLLFVTFLADMRSLGWLVRAFLKRLPELETAIAGNVPILPATAFAAEAERRAGRRALVGPPAKELHEAIADGSAAPALKNGLLTVGRLDDRGEICDMSSATRIRATPARVWPSVVDPKVRQDIVSIVDRGKIKRKTADRLVFTYSYVVRIGPLRKRYTTTVEARYRAPEAGQDGFLVAERGDTDGRPIQYADHLVADGDGAILCHTYWADLKTDWLSKRFLSSHPEMERLIGTYPPFILVRGIREHYRQYSEPTGVGHTTGTPPRT